MKDNSLNIDIICLDRTSADHRKEFNKYISIVFPGISFEEWFAKGFWTENYHPFSICESGKIISNVSVALMNVLINGKRIRAIQLGAVGTLPEYRNRGLSRKIINYVLEIYNDDVDFIFLFANESVMNFYPKFGFKRIKESVFVADAKFNNLKYSARKLNIDSVDDYHLLQDLLSARSSLTNIFGAEEYGFISMWHILNMYRKNLYFLENENTIVIKFEIDHKLHILDVIFSDSIDIEAVIPKIIEGESIESVKYYFPPDVLHFSYNSITQEDNGLFVHGESNLGSQPFKFPETAVT